MANRPPRRLRSEITRREALQHLGLGVTALAVGCGDSGPQAGDSPYDLAPPSTDAADPPDLGTTAPPDLAEPVLTPAQLLGGIDAIVVLMMENRSFDHYLGSLASDAKYPGKRRPDGLNGRESNPDPSGNPVTVFRLDDFTPEDPPHGWDACHRQWNSGKNDGFVKAHAGKSQDEVMGFHDRTQLPFYYALADRFTVCDRWFCSVMGPTWPNRFYLHAGTSGGKKDNSSYLLGGPTTIWERMKDKGRSAKNYFVGPVAWYMGAYPSKLLALNPCAKIDDFFSDCRNGTLPAFSIIDPDFLTNDDHPSHNIQLGQALIASIVQAIAKSPQWARTLLCITYDEHGGFHDHVPPPTAQDELADFQQLGFRVPTLLIGGTVRSAHVESTRFDHTSVGATLMTRHGIASLSKRMTAARDLSPCIDPLRIKNPAPPPTDLPKVPVRLREALRFSGKNSQPGLDHALRQGRVPMHLVDRRSDTERTLSWLQAGQALGAIDLSD
ncbi:MAG: alkaline phosphatase family protein [Polyangia bacterium]